MKHIAIFSFLLTLKCLNEPQIIETYQNNPNFSTTVTQNKTSFIAFGCRHVDYLNLLNHINSYFFVPSIHHILLEESKNLEAKVIETKNVYFFSIIITTSMQITPYLKQIIFKALEDSMSRLGCKNNDATYRKFSKKLVLDKLPYLQFLYFEMKYIFHYSESNDINKEIKLAYEAVRESLGIDESIDYNISIIVSIYEKLDYIILANLTFILFKQFSYIIITNTRESYQILITLQNMYQRTYGNEHSIFYDNRVMLPILYLNAISLSVLDPSNDEIHANSYVLLLIDLGFHLTN